MGGIPKFIRKNKEYNRDNYVLGESPPYLISHRGGSLDAPENTMQSFQFCVDNNIDMIECDVRLTKDGHIIVCHDDTFSRICLPSEKIKPGQTVLQTNLADLPDFIDKMTISFSADKSVYYQRKADD